jgi:signal peptidase
LVVLGVVARPGHDGISRIGGHPMLTVLSGSMTPVFRPGDLIVDDAVPTGKADQLVPGEIITFHAAGSSTNLITHKIAAVKHENGAVAYQTRGVANNAPDPELVEPSQVVGTYRSHVPMAGYLLQAVQKKTIFFLLILLPLLYLGYAELTKRREHDESTTESPVDSGVDPERIQEPALMGAGAARGNGAISALRRDVSRALQVDVDASNFTGEGGNASD